MKFIELKSTNPHYNLALEEYLFNNATESVFMLWQNDNTVVIGKNQNAYVEVDIDVLKNKNITLARRATGGGAVYHDLGNVNYSFINPCSQTEGIDFEYFTRPMISALKSLGVSASLSGRNDIETFDGLKISGSAQRRVGSRVLHHGTMLFSSDLSVLSTVLTPDREKLSSKAVKSVKKRVCNVSELCAVKSVLEFKSIIKNFIINELSATQEEFLPNKEVEELYKKYSSFEFVYGEKPFLTNYDKIYKKRFSFGSVELKLSIEKNVVKKAKFQGDFFELKELTSLEKAFENLPFTSLESIVQKIDFKTFISGMKSEDFISLIND